jgi:hypothetical protein
MNEEEQAGPLIGTIIIVLLIIIGGIYFSVSEIKIQRQRAQINASIEKIGQEASLIDFPDEDIENLDSENK